MSAAERAAEYLRGARRPDSPAGWTQKAQRDFVTEIDRTSERLIADALLARTPAARIVGEELAPELVREGLVWVVDPLDGTTNFLHGIPAFAVSIAAVQDGRLEAAVVLDVPHRERFEAVRGGGATCNGAAIRVSRIEDPAFALVGTGFPFRDVGRLAEYQRHFAAIDLAWVASGRYDGFWELRLAPWDIAAGVLLVREAGGVATDLEGDPDVVRETGLVAGNPAMHAWLLEVVRPTGRA